LLWGIGLGRDLGRGSSGGEEERRDKFLESRVKKFLCHNFAGGDDEERLTGAQEHATSWVHEDQATLWRRFWREPDELHSDEDHPPTGLPPEASHQNREWEGGTFGEKLVEGSLERSRFVDRSHGSHTDIELVDAH
jgi:hypothetical protein